MKKTLLLGIVIVSLMAVSASAQDSPWDKKLPFESATITIEVSGTMKGTKTIYVKDYGRTSAEYSETVMTMFGMTQREQEITITTPEWEYSIDMAGNTGTRQANPKKYLIQEFNRLSGNQQKTVLKNIEEMGISTIQGMNGTVEKNAAKILGYTCDKAVVMGIEAYTISGTELPLKIQGNTMGIAVNEVATGIDTGKVPESRFALPANIRFENDPETDQMMQAQAANIVQSILEGKYPTPDMTGNMMGGSDQDQLSPEEQQQLQQMMKLFGNQKN